MSNIRDIEDAFDAAMAEEANPLHVAVAIREIKDRAEAMLERMKPLVERELLKHPKGTATIDGWRLTATQGAAEWKYDHIPEWAELMARKKEIEDRAKTAYTSREKGIMVATADGEEIEAAVKTFKKDSIKFESPR